MNSQDNRTWIAVLCTAILLPLAITVLLALGLTVFWSQQRAPQVAALLRIGSAPSAEEETIQPFRDTHVALISSPYVVQAATRKPGISELPLLQSKADPARWIQEHLTVDCVEGSEIVRVSLSSSETDDAIALVDAIVASYIGEIVAAEQTQGVKALKTLRSERTAQRSDVRGRLSEWASQRDDTDQTEAETICDEQWRLEDELLATESELASLVASDQQAGLLDSKKSSVEQQLAEHSVEMQALLGRARMQDSLAKLASLNSAIQQAESTVSASPRIQVLQSAAAAD